MTQLTAEAAAQVIFNCNCVIEGTTMFSPSVAAPFAAQKTAKLSPGSDECTLARQQLNFMRLAADTDTSQVGYYPRVCEACPVFALAVVNVLKLTLPKA